MMDRATEIAHRVLPAAGSEWPLSEHGRVTALEHAANIIRNEMRQWMAQNLDDANSPLRAEIGRLSDELEECNAQIASQIATAKAYSDVAVTAEREACAKLAEDFPSYIMAMWDRPGGPPGNGARPATFKDIADAIRNRQ